MIPSLSIRRGRAGVLVIGGAVVEVDAEGRLFVKAGTAQYLAGLAATFGTVHFFAPAVTKERLEYASRFGPGIVFYPLTHINKSGLPRLRALAEDVCRICRAGICVAAALEFFPFAGGLIASTLLRAVSTRYGLYFGTDPYVPIRSIPSISGISRQLMKLLACSITSRFADFVLARDPRHLSRLGTRLGGRAHLSAPISALPRPISIRLNRCEGEQITLLYVGMFSHRKGLNDLLEVVALLSREQSRSYRLLLVGAPEMLGLDQYTVVQLQEMCQALSIERSVEFCGYLDDMVALGRIFESADLLVLASRREGFPRVVEEALLFGLPVVAFEIASLSELLCNGLHAMLVPPGDVEAFARAIQRVVSDSVLRRTLAIQGRALMLNRFPVPAFQQHAGLLRSSETHVARGTTL